MKVSFDEILRIFEKIIFIVLLFCSASMLYTEFRYYKNANHSLAEIHRLWWECNNCEDETYYASFTFKNAKGETIFIKKDSVDTDIWLKIESGEIPALVEYYPQNDMEHYRFVGEHDYFWSIILLIFAFIIYSRNKKDSKPRKISFKKTRISRHNSKR